MPERRGRTETLTFARLVPVPENRSALLAVQRLAAAVGPAGFSPIGYPDPLFLHGPPGTGKTHVVSALLDEVCRRCRGLSVTIRAVGDGIEDLGDADLLVLEDLQHLPYRSVEGLVRRLNERWANTRPTVVTASAGPRHLPAFSERLRSRLTAGLVVGLEPFAEASRRAILGDQAQRRQIAVRPAALAWLAKQLPGSGRAVHAALDRLEELARARPAPLELADVQAAGFATSASGVRVERIAREVSHYFQVGAQQMQSRCRYRHVLLPRQVGMYLARRLTALSLEEIGAYFGGRDHSTVLHACRKVEAAMAGDAVLSGAVQRLQGELGQ
jgi:chromosomal replication initiator protein